MPWNLLLFPLVGGYWLVVRFKLLRYYHQRIDRQKLVFNSIVAGVFLLLLSLIITSLMAIYFPATAKELSDLSPISLPFLGTNIGAFVLGVSISEIGNSMINTEKAVKLSIRYIGNELELLFEASYRTPHLVCISLKNEKVYIGWIKALPIPGYSNYITLTPAFSGFRNKDTKELKITTQYLDVYASFVRDGLTTNIKSLSHLVLKIDEISTAFQFEIETYERFNNSVSEN